MFRTAATLLLSGCLLLLMAAKAAQAAEPGEGAWMYGVGVSQQSTVVIQQFNPLLAISEEVLDTGLDKYANALGFDPARDQLFFMVQNNFGNTATPELQGFYFFSVATMEFTRIASLNDVGIGDVSPSNVVPYSAAYYDSQCLRGEDEMGMCVCARARVCVCACVCGFVAPRDVRDY